MTCKCPHSSSITQVRRPAHENAYQSAVPQYQINAPTNASCTINIGSGIVNHPFPTGAVASACIAEPQRFATSPTCPWRGRAEEASKAASNTPIPTRTIITVSPGWWQGKDVPKKLSRAEDVVAKHLEPEH